MMAAINAKRGSQQLIMHEQRRGDGHLQHKQCNYYNYLIATINFEEIQIGYLVCGCQNS
jgi:hypothetical protein